MEIRLYKSFVKKADSTLQPTGNYITKQVRLKENTSVNAPTFLLSEYDDTYNYVYVPRWNRYYFRNDATLNIQGVFELSLTLDHLATFKTQIGTYNCFVERCADSRYYDVMLNDPLISVKQQATKQQHTLANSSLLSDSQGSYVIRMAGDSDYGISTFVTDDLANFRAIFNKAQYFDDSDPTNWITVVGNYIFDPYEYVVGVYWSPIKLSTYRDDSYGHGVAAPVYVKWFDTGITATRLPNGRKIRFSISANTLPTNMYTDFRKYNPNFSKYSIDIPGVGMVDIDGNYVNENLSIGYYVNLDDGATKVTLDNIGGGDLTTIASYSTNLYKSLQYGTDSPNITAIASGGVNTIGGIMSGNFPLATISGMNVVKNILVPTPSTGGSQGGNVWEGGTIELTNYASADLDVTNKGRTCYKNLTLGNLTGYIQCANANINNIAGTLEDKRLVNNSLNNGFFYE